jgi:asparagine synthase (glutamine-hydrolysing)
MCGIAGFCTASPQTVGPWFAAAVSAAAHRGPDDDGYWFPGLPGVRQLGELTGAAPTNVAFGHLRLSIVDLSELGRQPFVSDDGQTALTFNGEIYNFVELRAELEALGHRFRSATDSEVILHGWKAWGLDLFARMNGMWAIGLWDAASGSLVLSRDRLGEKPLFIMDWRGGIAFASEIKQLRAFPDVTFRPDADQLARFIATGRPYVGSTGSFFDGVTQIEPGTSVVINGQSTRTYRYYDLNEEASKKLQLSSDEIADATYAAFLDSVRIRLRADVEVGTCLSSGVDSTAVVAAMRELEPEVRPHTFTFGFGRDRSDERAVAAATAERVGARWHSVDGQHDDFNDVVDRLTWHHETPLPEASLYAQWSVFRAAREARVKVMLDGQGADEVFGGYIKFLAGRARADLRTDPRGAVFAAYGLVRQMAAHPKTFLWAARYVRLPNRASGYSVSMPGQPTAPPLAGDLQMRVNDLTTWSLPNLLPWEDRNSMAHGVETRLPFLDPNLLALGLAAPSHVLYRKGWTKWPVREITARLGQPAIAWRRAKLQFASPEDGWMRTRSEENTTRSELWSTLAGVTQVGDLLRLAEAGEATAVVRRRAINDFFTTFWPEASPQPAPCGAGGSASVAVRS